MSDNGDHDFIPRLTFAVEHTRTWHLPPDIQHNGIYSLCTTLEFRADSYNTHALSPFQHRDRFDTVIRISQVPFQSVLAAKTKYDGSISGYDHDDGIQGLLWRNKNHSTRREDEYIPHDVLLPSAFENFVVPRYS